MGFLKKHTHVPGELTAMTPIVRKLALLCAAMASLGGCSFASNSTPVAASNTGGAARAIHPQSLSAPARTGVVYSTHVALSDRNGRRRVGEAIVFPEKLLRGFGTEPAIRAAIASLRKPHDPSSITYVVYLAGATGTSNLQGYSGWNVVNDFSVGYGPSQKNNRKFVSDLAFDRPVDVVSPYILTNLFAGTVFNGSSPGGGNKVLLDVLTSQGGGKQTADVTFTFVTAVPDSYSSAFSGGLTTESVAIQFKSATFCVNDNGTPTCSDWNPQQ
jgi:hypothetical protein